MPGQLEGGNSSVFKGRVSFSAPFFLGSAYERRTAGSNGYGDGRQGGRRC